MTTTDSLRPNETRGPDRLLRLLETAAESPGESPDWSEALEATVRDLAASYEHFDWTGIYLMDGTHLVLGPYVGRATEHVRIPVGRGICGAAAESRETIVVDDVNADPRYLACFASTRSEIVVPIFAGGDPGRPVIGEIDVDSDRPEAFGQADQHRLERIAELLGRLAPESPARRLDASLPVDGTS